MPETLTRIYDKLDAIEAKLGVLANNAAGHATTQLALIEMLHELRAHLLSHDELLYKPNGKDLLIPRVDTLEWWLHRAQWLCGAVILSLLLWGGKELYGVWLKAQRTPAITEPLPHTAPGLPPAPPAQWPAR